MTISNCVFPLSTLLVLVCLGCNKQDAKYVACPQAEKPGQTAFSEVAVLKADLAMPPGLESVRSLEVLGDGSLLIVDSRARRLAVVSAEGRLVRQFGRQGKGPGEFDALLDADVDRQGTIWALDAGNVRVSSFGANGRLRNSFTLRAGDPRHLMLVGDSVLIVGGLVDPGQSKHTVSRYGLDGTFQASFITADSLLFAMSLLVDDVWVVPVSADVFATGLAILPTVTLASSRGAVICTQITTPSYWRQITPAPANLRTPNAMQQFIDASSLVVGVSSVGDGSFIVQSQVNGDEAYAATRYSSHGALIAEYSGMPGRLVGAAGADLYFVTEQVEGPVIKVYTLRKDAG